MFGTAEEKLQGLRKSLDKYKFVLAWVDEHIPEGERRDVLKTELSLCRQNIELLPQYLEAARAGRTAV